MPRRLGQHFLRPASVERLLGVIDPREGDVFLEIGPGAGALTLPLAARAREVIAVELDASLPARLRERAPTTVRILSGDALRVPLDALTPAGPPLLATLPYYSSTPLLRPSLSSRP